MMIATQRINKYWRRVAEKEKKNERKREKGRKKTEKKTKILI